MRWWSATGGWRATTAVSRWSPTGRGSRACWRSPDSVRSSTFLDPARTRLTTSGIPRARFSCMESKRSELLRASPRMFENDLLDRFSRVHHFVPLAIFLPVIAVFLYLGFDRVGTGGTLLLGLGGYLFWSLSEYWIHRAIFHWEPEDGWGAKLHWMIHGVHHDHPNDPLRLVMPPAASIPLATLFVIAFVVVIGTPNAWPFAAGFLAGYLI